MADRVRAKVVRAPSFAQAVSDLENGGEPGIKATVDLFIKALRAGADKLGGRQLDDGSFVQRADNPSNAAAGRGEFCVQYRRSGADGQGGFTLIDMWKRPTGGELPDPE